MRKKVGKTKRAGPKRRSSPKTRRFVATPQYSIIEESSYEKALAKSVINYSLPLECDDSVTLIAAISSLTTSLKRLSYNYGLSVGRSIYKVFDEKKHYKWYGDSIEDIVLFFERLGYSYILHKILTNNIEILIYRKNKTNVGCNIHSFDAGLMAGFLGAARGEFTKVTEVSCCNNGSHLCRFTTAPSIGDMFCTEVDKLSAIVDGAKSDGKIRPEYQMLCLGPLTRHEYLGQISAVFYHLGHRATMEFPKGKMSREVLHRSQLLMERFGLGKLEYSQRPLKLAILLDGAKAKKEFVDISSSFLSGMMQEYFAGQMRSQIARGRKGNYKIVVKQ